LHPLNHTSDTPKVLLQKSLIREIPMFCSEIYEISIFHQYFDFFSPYFPLLSFVSKDLLSPFSLLMGSMQRLPCNPFLHTTNCRKCRALPGHLEKFLRLLGVSTPIVFLWHVYTNYHGNPKMMGI
jgi:hypothetical protein